MTYDEWKDACAKGWRARVVVEPDGVVGRTRVGRKAGTAWTRGRGWLALALGRWSTAAGRRFVRERVYWRGRWTPLVRVWRRYARPA